ncbi:MAG: hypothetical protein BroJett022_13700 [Actinomycetes bacterium]|nr:MAG: hypothetical protein BroJett022_13700 [Actinomycetes bacterium]
MTEREPDTGGDDPSRRTRLAAERTMLAWWRTALAALAVGIGVGRIVPELSGAETEWPYAALGFLFALYGIVLFAFGSRRFGSVERAVGAGGYRELGGGAAAVLAGVGVVLGLAMSLLVLLG